MSLNEFRLYALAKKQIEYHSYNPNAKFQCTDLANDYILKVWRLTGIIGTNAKDFPERLSLGMEFIKNAVDYLPEAGELAVWNGQVGGGAGHISVVLKKGLQTTFQSLDQNWSKPLFITQQKHSYTNVRGFIRKLQSTPEPMSDTIQLDTKTFEQLVSKSTERDAFRAAGINSVSDIDTLRSATTQAQQERGTALEEASTVRQELATFKTQVAEKLQSTQDLPRLLSTIDDLMKKMEQAVSDGQKEAKENQVYEKQIIELQAEITRLRILVKGTNPLSAVTASELLRELITRITSILNKG